MWKQNLANHQECILCTRKEDVVTIDHWQLPSRFQSKGDKILFKCYLHLCRVSFFHQNDHKEDRQSETGQQTNSVASQQILKKLLNKY